MESDSNSNFVYVLCTSKEDVKNERQPIIVTTKPPAQHVWEYKETLALIKSMQTYFDDLAHPRKRRHVFENIQNDLLTAGFSVTAKNCQVKWKNLVRTFTIAQDVKNRTGRGPVRFQFYDEMYEIFGSNPPNQLSQFLELTENTEYAEVVEHESSDENTDPPLLIPKTVKKRKYTNIEVEEIKQEERESGQHVWHYDESMALIKSMKTHHADLAHPTKRKNVFEKVQSDLLDAGYAVTSKMCQVKWKNLMRSYKVSKDEKERSGRGPTRFHFYNDMYEILETKSPNSAETAKEAGDSVAEPVEEQVYEAVVVPQINTRDERRRKKMSIEIERIRQEEKNKRHRERMEIERQKLEVEIRKCELLEKYIELRNSEK